MFYVFSAKTWWCDLHLHISWIKVMSNFHCYYMAFNLKQTDDRFLIIEAISVSIKPKTVLSNFIITSKS